MVNRVQRVPRVQPVRIPHNISVVSFQYLLIFLPR